MWINVPFRGLMNRPFEGRTLKPPALPEDIYFINALKRLSESIGLKEDLIEKGLNDIYLDLTIKRFEFTFEMSWKTIKRFLDFMGLDCKFPRSCFKEAYSQNLISNEEIWLDMIESRNLSSHVYDEMEIMEIVNKIEKYIESFQELKNNIEKNLRNN
jgi:nucleotidyltransferase substrate binding protein (TIGR01987 family)